MAAHNRATLADVAELAGVSVPTVSKVVRGRSDVSTETRARVHEAMKTAGYEFGNDFKKRRIGSIDLVIDGLDSLWALEVIRGAEEAAAEIEESVVVISTRHGSVPPKNWLRSVADHPSDGVVVALTRTGSDTVDRLRSLGVPLVLLDPIGQPDPVIPTVGASNWFGALSATQHFLSLGHRRIGIITGPDDVACSQERVDGYRAALTRAGIDPSPELVVPGDFLVGGGRKGAEALLDLAEPPTAIFACGDLAAAGVYQAATERSIRIPDDLSVIGFDDIPICELLSPPLTTIRQPIAEMAAESVRLVNQQRERSKPHTGSHLQLTTSLVVRQSTAAPATVRS